MIEKGFVHETLMRQYFNNRSFIYIVENPIFYEKTKLLKWIVMWYRKSTRHILMNQSMRPPSPSLRTYWLNHLEDFMCSLLATSWPCTMYMLRLEKWCNKLGGRSCKNFIFIIIIIKWDEMVIIYPSKSPEFNFNPNSDYDYHVARIQASYLNAFLLVSPSDESLLIWLEM